MGEPGHVGDLFERHHFDPEVVKLCVRWYMQSGLSLREIVDRMAERGLPVAHTTLMRWVRRCAGACGRRTTGSDGFAPGSWRVEETRVKVRGEQRYLYRAVDRTGQTIDFRFADSRDAARAETFFGIAIRYKPAPQAAASAGCHGVLSFRA